MVTSEKISLQLHCAVKVGSNRSIIGARLLAIRGQLEFTHDFSQLL